MTEKSEIVEIKNEATRNKIDIEKKSTVSQLKETPKKRTESKKLQKKLKEQKKKLNEITKERDEFKDRYLRNLAEIDNFRKRIKKEKEEYQRYVLSEFLLNLLEIFDNLERALQVKNPSDADKSIISGVEMIYKQFVTLLKKYDVEEIVALNETFDPSIHQAISKVEKDGIEESIVIEVYQKGFLYNKKLLRPSFVKVAVPVEVESEAVERE